MIVRRVTGLRPLLAMAIVHAMGCHCQADTPVQVAMMDLDQPGTVMPADYLGVSYEMERVLPDSQGIRYFRPENRPLINMFKTLGIKSLRLGGNTADRATVGLPDENDIDNLFAFARDAGVKVIYTLRLKGGNPSQSAATAKYIWDHHREFLTGFAIGNEPNVFTSDYNQFLETWKQHEQAILAVAPGAKFCGPAATSGKAAWAKDFAAAFAESRQIAAITYHLYPGGNSGLVTDPATGRAEMLSTKWVGDYQKMADGFVPTVLQKKLNYRLEEANSFWNGGAKDVSDTHAAAVWALDYLWWWRSRGAGGLNFHTGDQVAKQDTNTPCYYALFWSTEKGYSAHPVAYGFEAFNAGFGAGKGEWVQAHIRDNSDALNITAYCVRSAEATWVTLINKEVGAGARSAKVSLPDIDGKRPAAFMRLEAPGGDAAAKESRFGGASISESGTWDGQWTAMKANPAFEIAVPATSAVVVKIPH